MLHISTPKSQRRNSLSHPSNKHTTSCTKQSLTVIHFSNLIPSNLVCKSQGGTQGMVRTSTIEARTREFLHKWLPLRLLERLFEMVKTIHHRVLPGSENPAFQFPRPPGSHLPEDSLGTAALAFVRTICHVLGLDNTCQDEVRTASFLSDPVLRIVWEYNRSMVQPQAVVWLCCVQRSKRVFNAPCFPSLRYTVQQSFGTVL